MSYGSYESTRTAELEDGREIEFEITLDCVTLSSAAQLYGESGDCYPAEAPEFELDSVHVLHEDGKSVEISEEILAAFLGQTRAKAMIEVAITEAMESGEF